MTSAWRVFGAYVIGIGVERTFPDSSIPGWPSLAIGAAFFFLPTIARMLCRQE